MAISFHKGGFQEFRALLNNDSDAKDYWGVTSSGIDNDSINFIPGTGEVFLGTTPLNSTSGGIIHIYSQEQLSSFINDMTNAWQTYGQYDVDCIELHCDLSNTSMVHPGAEIGDNSEYHWSVHANGHTLYNCLLDHIYITNATLVMCDICYSEVNSCFIKNDMMNPQTQQQPVLAHVNFENCRVYFCSSDAYYTLEDSLHFYYCDCWFQAESTLPCNISCDFGNSSLNFINDTLLSYGSANIYSCQLNMIAYN